MKCPPLGSGAEHITLPDQVAPRGQMSSSNRTNLKSRTSPSTTPTDTMVWEGRTWVHCVASLSNFRDPVPGDISTPDNQQPAPSTYMTLMYNKH